MVTRVDRLARSIGDLQDIVRALKAKGAALKATEQPIDTSTAAGKGFLDMLGYSRSLRPTCGVSGSLMGLPRPKQRASIEGASRALMRSRSSV